MSAVTPISSKTGVLLIGKQSAQGTPATTFFKPTWLSGTPKVNMTVQEQEVIDGSTFSSPTRYVSSLAGGGTSMKVQGDALTIARLLAWFVGNDTFASTGTPANSHTSVIGETNEAAWLTVAYSLGVGDAQRILQFSDCRLTELQIEGSSQSRVVEATFSFSCLTPGTNLATLPTAAVTAGEPFFYQENDGSFTFGSLLNGGEGVAYCKQFQLAIKREQTELYGDAIAPYALLGKIGAITFTATLGGNDETIGLVNQYLYGTATPAANAEVTGELLNGPFSFQLTKGALQVGMNCGNVNYAITEPEANASADEVDVPAAGRVLADAGVFLTSVSVTGEDVAY